MQIPGIEFRHGSNILYLLKHVAELFNHTLKHFKIQTKIILQKNIQAMIRQSLCIRVRFRSDKTFLQSNDKLMTDQCGQRPTAGASSTRMFKACDCSSIRTSYRVWLILPYLYTGGGGQTDSLCKFGTLYQSTDVLFDTSIPVSFSQLTKVCVKLTGTEGNCWQ